jgi:hypothetical protein
MDLKADEVRGSIRVLQKSLTDIWIQRLSENSRTVVPKTEYNTASVKAFLTRTLSQSVAGSTPIPLVMQDAIGAALKIIELSEVRRIPP